jgi:UDPglucose 6-dehydrogenase
MNEIANICELVGADVNQVRLGVGSDYRIGYSFMYPGIGYGGTCFPKDINALIELSKENGYIPELISSVERVNQKQKKLFLDKVIKRFGEDLTNLTFAIWGLSFKPETDDMRNAPSVYVITELLKKGAKVKVYDPRAMNKSKTKYLKDAEIYYATDKYDAIKNTDGLILLTEWKEFRSPDFEEIKKQMKQTIIFDGRNQYRTFDLEKRQFEYYQIGKL